MEKKNLLIIAGIAIILLIGIIIVKMNTDKRQDEIEAAKSQSEKDAEALAERIKNPQTAEDYYQVFLAGKLEATTSKSGTFGTVKKINLYDMNVHLKRYLNSRGAPDQLQMISYCMVKAEDSDIPDLVLRFHYVRGNDKNDYANFVCALHYMGEKNVKIIEQMWGSNTPTFVSANGFIDGEIAVRPLNDPNYTATYHQYRKVGVNSAENTFVADVIEYLGYKSCIVPKEDLIPSLVTDESLAAVDLIDTKNAEDGYKYTYIELKFHWINEGDDYYKENVFCAFSNADSSEFYPADPEFADFYKENGVNVLDPDKAGSFLKEVFAKHGLDYDTCFNAPEATWIDIACPPWGPY